MRLLRRSVVRHSAGTIVSEYVESPVGSACTSSMWLQIPVQARLVALR